MSVEIDNIQLVVAGVVGLLAVVVAYLYVNSSSKGKACLVKKEFVKFPLAQKTVLSHNSAVYRFSLPKPSDYLGLPIGQHISIGAEINGKEVVRSYTPLSLDEEKGYFDLLIKSYPNGNISKYVSELKIGDSIRVRGPKGFFEFVPNATKHYAMVCGGTGIAPMYQLIQAIIRNPDDKSLVTLIYGNVNEEDILLKKELDEIMEKHKNIRVYYILDHPPENWTGGKGFCTEQMMKEQFPAPSEDTRLLLCGPPMMVSSVKKAAVNLGWAKARPVSRAGDQVFVF